MRVENICELKVMCTGKSIGDDFQGEYRSSLAPVLSSFVRKYQSRLQSHVNIEPLIVLGDPIDFLITITVKASPTDFTEMSSELVGALSNAGFKV